MMALRLLPVALMLLVLGAHFLRSGDLLLVLAALALIALLFVRRSWAARTVQVGLLLGSLEWLRVLAFLVAERRAEGQPFLRLLLILGSVALATGLCALLFRGERMRDYFRMGAPVS